MRVANAAAAARPIVRKLGAADGGGPFQMSSRDEGGGSVVVTC